MRPGVDYIGVGVGAVISDDDGRLLLALRGPGAQNERGMWEFPGGAVEYGETLQAALRREMREEFGIEVEVKELLEVADHLLPAENQHWVSPTFLCRICSGVPAVREQEKCSAVGWFFPDRLPENLSVVTRGNLACYLKHFDRSGHAR